MGMGKPTNGMRVAEGVGLFRAPQGDAGRDYVYVNGQWIMRACDAIPSGVAEISKHFHPRGLAHRAPGLHRAVGHALSNPGLIVTGFAALALYGLPYLTDNADTVLKGPTVRGKQEASIFAPALVRDTCPQPIWRVNYLGHQIRVVPPPVAVAQALRLLRSGEVAWRVEPVPGLEPEYIRAVQLIDCARHFIDLDAYELLAACKSRVNLTWLVSVLEVSSAKAESPKETEMRLLARTVADRFGLTLEEQVVVRADDGTIITRLDLALPQLKIGLMYDGGQHWTPERRSKDTLINLEAIGVGWQMLRFSSGTLRLLIEVLAGLLEKRLPLARG